MKNHITTEQLKWLLASALGLICTNLLTSGPTAVRSLDKIISGAEVEVSGNLQTCVVVEDPVLYGAVVTVLHCGAVGAVLQTADGQTWLGDDVEEGVPLRRAGSGEGQMAVKASLRFSYYHSLIFKWIHLSYRANLSSLTWGRLVNDKLIQWPNSAASSWNVWNSPRRASNSQCETSLN